MIPQTIKRKYDQLLPLVTALSDKVSQAVLNYCNKKGFAYTGRIKTLESFSEKIDTGRFSSLENMNDLFACTIIIPTLNDEEQVLEFLKDTFEERSVRLRGSTKKHPEQFRFDATRFYGTYLFPEAFYPDALEKKIIFEVQIRTAFEHAWSVATHALTYKSDQIDWRLLRLTAQLKAAVEQLDSLIRDFEQSSKSIIAHEWPELESKQRLLNYFLSLANKHIAKESCPKNWSRFIDSVYSLLGASNGRRKHEVQSSIDPTIEAVNARLTTMNIDSFPLSVSLFQFTAATLIDAGIIRWPLYEYYLTITSEMEELYPKCKEVQPRFILE